MTALLFAYPSMPAWFYALYAIPAIAMLVFALVVLWREGRSAFRLAAASGAACLMAALYLSIWLPGCGDVAWYIVCWPF